ncbi:MAG: hypothetical protein HRT94_03465 [Alphaproteobacteria bacterium]|nr:hypothetical protein [Alphaproteobacteria bacterium]
MRLVFLIILFVIHSSTAFALGGLYNKDSVVRGFVWGVSPQDVSQFESGKFLKSEGDNAFYSDEIFGRESTIGYQFVQGQLNRVRIDIHQHYTDPQDWIRLLMKVNHSLSERWGVPLSEDFVWADEKHKNYPDDWGIAVMMKHMKASMRWVAKDTFVDVSLQSVGRMRPVLTVVYQYKRPSRAVKKSQSAPQPAKLADDGLLLP